MNLKRILILCIVSVFLMSLGANAQVSKGKDVFTNGVDVASFIQPDNFFNTIHFVKNISEGIAKYEFSISRIRGGGIMY